MVWELCIVEFAKERLLDRIEELNTHFFGVLLNFEHFQQSIGSLSSSIFLLVPPQNPLDILLGEVGRINQAGNGIVWSELVFDHLVLEGLREICDDLVREVVAAICVHISTDLELCCQLIESYFEFNLVPEHHWWQLVIVLAGAHDPVSGILESLLQLLHILGLYYLVQLLAPFFSEFLEINERVASFLDHLDVLFLTLE